MIQGKPQNPFSSRNLEPARGGYIFPDGLTLQYIVNQLEQSKWRSELVGIHGAGKSTLLTDLCNQLTYRNIKFAHWHCNDRRRTLPKTFIVDLCQYEIIVLDGAESLLPGLLPLLKFLTMLFKRGLIITVHSSTRFGSSLTVNPSPSALAEKLRRLGITCYSEDELANRLRKHNGNCREVLFDLYMEYEAE